MTNYVVLPPVRLDGQIVQAGSVGFTVPGESAYALAVDGGFIGTETEWLQSLSSAALPGMGYWVLKANSSTTFPARTTIPSWWVGSVQYDSTDYLNHSDPSDRVTGDQHLKRTS